MHKYWHNPIGKVLASSVAALLATTSLHAIPKGPCDTKPEVCCEEPKPGPFAFSYPLDMNISCPRDFYVHADGLAFQAKQEGMEYGIINGSGSTSNGISNGTVLGFSNDHHDWDYNPGVRIGIGFYLDHDAWNVDFAWTWLNITDYQNSTAQSGSGIILPLNLVPNSTPAGALNASNVRCGAVWKASYNTLDAKLAKPYYVSRLLVLSPHFGVRAAWIDQHYSVDYAGSFGTTGAYRAIAHSNNDLWAFGARTGLNSDWILGKGWCLFGNAAASILFSKFQIDQHCTYSNPAEGYNLDYDFYQNTPNFEIALGIAWGQYFDKNKYHIGLRAAYEFHEWININNVRRFFGGGTYYPNDTTARGNFSLNGFSFSVALDM
ncbi:MAG: hypothetical protein JSS32_11045 [Verrucomicrobia bacterium]|nr:hypothetical protein [Verrucomicrobiota bacterium]